MEKDKLLTIKEFAELAGKSQQAIYKQLNNRLNPFVQLVENQKMLEYRALWEVYGIEVEQPIQPKLNNQFNQNSTDFKAILNLLEKQNEQLQRELDIKNKQIEDLSEALTNTTSALKAAQALHAGTIQQQLIGEPQETSDKPSLFKRLFGKKKTE